jgi:hypothetical protein
MASGGGTAPLAPGWRKDDALMTSAEAVSQVASAAPGAGAAAPVAVVIWEEGEPADARMEALALACRARGLKVSGLIQRNGGRRAGGDFSMEMREIEPGGEGSVRPIPLLDPSIAAGRGCRLDVAALAAAASLLAPERHRGSDLVIVNKFGRQESLGRGLRDEMAALIMSGLPVLTSVRASLRPSFEAFVGDGYVAIAPTPEAVTDWLSALREMR